MDTHPYLFENSDEIGSVKIITDPEVIIAEQKRQYSIAVQKGVPTSYFDIGVVSEDEWYATIRDCVILANGNPGVYVRFICKKGRYQNAYNVVVIPYFENQLMLSRQFIHSERKWVWQTPRGFGEPNLGAEQNAAKELNEEVGYVADKLVCIYERDDNTAVFFAKMSNISPFLPTSDEREITDIKWIYLKELKNLILLGEITDCDIIRAYVYLDEYGFPQD
jgi:ADP-ribose pyrophosphatase